MSPPPNPGPAAPIEAPPTPGDPLVQDPIYRAAHQADGLQLRELFDLLLRGRRIIAGVTLAVLLPVALYTFTRPDLYSAYAIVLVHKRDRDLADILPTSPASAFFQDERNLENELLILRQSMPLADSAARRVMAIGRVPGSGEDLTILEVPEDRPMTPALVGARLQGGYVHSALEGTDVDAIRVTATSTVPGEAAMLANVYADEFITRSRQSSRAGAAASRAFLEDQISSQGGALSSADDAVRRFMVREGAVALDEESSRTVSQLAQLEAQRDEADIEIRMKLATVEALERELAGIEPRLAGRVASGADREIATLQTRIAELATRLEQIYIRNPELRDAANPPAAVSGLGDQIATLEGRVRTLTNQLVADDIAVGGGGPGDQSTGFQRAAELRRRLIDERVALSGVEAQRAVLTQRVAQYEGQLRTLPTQSIELAQLQRDRQATETLYRALEQRLQEARLAEQSEIGYAELIRPATVPWTPYSPNRPRNLLLGLMLGLGAGAAIALARLRLDDRVFRPDDLRDAGYPVLGTIPDVSDLVRADFGGNETVEVDGQRLDTRIVTLLNPISAASEGYRALRTSIQFSRPDAVVQTILVTSAKPGEGKSTTAVNLAVVMAQSGRRTLLIDGDLRRPTVHRQLGRPARPGLVDLLFQEGAPDLAPYITPIDDLVVIPAGARAPNPSELLGSRAMRDLLATLREQFDVIVIDAPPVLAATDPVLLSTQADATFVVVSSGSTHRHELAHTYDALSSVGARIIGVVLNRFDLTHAYGYRYKYAYRYGRTYGYGSEDREAPRGLAKLARRFRRGRDA